jgi:hypothetical protein
MVPLRDLVQKDTYLDSPEFSDEFLLPALAAGHNVTLVTAFAPSYLFRLINDLYSSPEIEPGLLRVVFCVPLLGDMNLSKARLLSKYFSAFASTHQEVRVFIKGLQSLSAEGNVQVSALFSTQATMLTPSCIGIVESGEYSSQDLISLVDPLAEDFNSPITVGRSWDQNSEEFQDVKRAVTKALFENFSNILRVTPSELLQLVDEIAIKGYPRLDVSGGGAESSVNLPSRSSSPGKTKKKGDSDLNDEELEDELELEFLVSTSFEDEEIDELLRDVSWRDFTSQSESLDEFLGFDVDFVDFSRGSFERSHAGPMAYDLAELLGNGIAVCWCGQEYDRSDGCPESFY